MTKSRRGYVRVVLLGVAIAALCAGLMLAFLKYVIIGDGWSIDVRVHVVRSPDGRLLEWSTVDQHDSGLRVFGNMDGSLDLGRSGHYEHGVRSRGLTAEEARNHGSGRARVERDIRSLMESVSVFTARVDDLPNDVVIRASAFARRLRAPASFADLIAYPPARAKLNGSEVVYHDPWGHGYELLVAPDPLAPMPDGVTITIYTRGSDGRPGGEGDAADVGCAINWGGCEWVNSIP